MRLSEINALTQGTYKKTPIIDDDTLTPEEKQILQDELDKQYKEKQEKLKAEDDAIKQKQQAESSQAFQQGIGKGVWTKMKHALENIALAKRI